MGTMADDLRAVLDLANDTYAAGYRDGVAAGRREAFAEIRAILRRPPDQPQLDVTVPPAPGDPST